MLISSEDAGTDPYPPCALLECDKSVAPRVTNVKQFVGYVRNTQRVRSWFVEPPTRRGLVEYLL